MEPTWTWSEDSKQVSIGEQDFRIKADTTPAAIVEFGTQLLMMARVHKSIIKASVAFEDGRAGNYDNARETLRGLLRELDESANDLGRKTMEFTGFFEPAGIIKAFNGNKEDWPRFVHNAIERLSARTQDNGKRTAPQS